MKRLLLSVVLALSVSVAAAAQTLPTVKVATTPIDVGSGVLYAKDMGFFQKHGLNVDVQFIDNGAAIASAVASGAIDIAQGNVVTLATAHDKGLPFVVVAPAALYSSSSPTSALIVAKNSPVTSAKDLNGKTIGITGVKNITQIATMAWLDQNGGDSSTVKFIELTFSQMGPAVVAGRIDAGVTAEPDLTDAVASGGVRILAPVYNAVAPTFIIGAWFATSDWAKAHPDVVTRYVAAINEAAVWANKNQAASAKILEKYTKVDAKPGMKRVIFPEKSDLALMQPAIDVTAKYKVIKATFPATELAPK
ncbi:MAG TPA: ABC transporter substrate-binding protein [Candidatus Lustribacter sp.]|jgi:NitT/TauT family transport system substrate-binding protein|nr:ABC transporter substrate-binding protein [Candidatus Lustribacter sp.]